MNKITVINVFNSYFVVAKVKRGKEIYKDSLAFSVGTGTVFESEYQARAYAQELSAKENLGNKFYEIRYIKHLYDQCFDVWVVTHQTLRVKYSVFVCPKSESLTESEIREKLKYGEYFAERSAALEFANKIVDQFNLLFGNFRSAVCEETIVEESEEMDMFYDNYGKPLFLFKIPYWRDEDIQYRFVDVLKYNDEIRKHRNEICEKPLSLPKQLGAESACKTAKDTAIPVLHYEIFRTEKLLAVLNESAETSSDELEFYSSYAQTLSECIEIQKQCRLPDNFKLTAIVFDERKQLKRIKDCCEKISFSGISLNYCEKYNLLYDIEVFYDCQEFFDAVNDDSSQIVFVMAYNKASNIPVPEIHKTVYGKSLKPVYFCRKRTHITKILEEHIRLSLVSESIIDDEWIYETVEKIDNVEDEESDFGNDAFCF